MKCSVCTSEIKENYCPKCGQFYKNERITIKTIFGDLFSNIFSLEKSFLKNIKVGLFQPKTLITNYWEGFRNYYYSPSRFLVVASLFFVLQSLLGKPFLGLDIKIKLTQQFSILLLVIMLFSFLSYIVFFKFKRNFYEHLILNIYNVSLWSIIFIPISLVLSSSIILSYTQTMVLFLYMLLIIIWNAKVFDMSIIKRFVYVLLNLILLIAILSLFYKYFGSSN